MSVFPGSISEILVFPGMIEATQLPLPSHQRDMADQYFSHCWVACILTILHHNIGIYESNTMEVNRSQTITAINNMSSTSWIPDHIVEGEAFPPCPILRPILEIAEPWELPFHRGFVLLQYLHLTHTSESGREAYLDARQHSRLDEFEVTEQDIPWWMCRRA